MFLSYSIALYDDDLFWDVPVSFGMPMGVHLPEPIRSYDSLPTVAYWNAEFG